LTVKIGTCGWSAKGGRSRYFQTFNVVELQSTFYQLPRPETADRWRSQAPEGFEFTVKAWQAVTHPPSSPTWRRCRFKPPRDSWDKYGFLRPTEENFNAWEQTLDICRRLQAKICVFQTPSSFRYSEENAGNVEAFFTSIHRDGLRLGWEPRGTWHEHPEEVRRLCESLDLIHVVDPLRRPPSTAGDILYFRLHGLGGREVNYRYRYTDDDLRRLAGIVKSLGGESRDVYVMFNNVFMFEDALRFKETAARLGLEVA